jgi:dUTP pyrophosphatase
VEKKDKILEGYLRKLEELDRRINDGTDSDDALIDDLNRIINGISKEVESSSNSKTIPSLQFINHSNNPDPSFAHEGDSGFDLRAYISDDDIEIAILPGEIEIIPTGLYFEVEKGLEIQIRPRSGLAAKHGITIVNTPGTIDSHYRGEIQIILANLGRNVFRVNNGDRIAQGVVCPVYGEGKLNMIKAEKLSETVRNDSRFGSSGVK